jgi:hypothetical protein
MTEKNKDEKVVGPEDVRPPFQAFIQAQLVYKGSLLEVRDTLEKQRSEAESKGSRRKLTALLLEVNNELGRIEPSIEKKMERVKKERLRPV